MSDSIWKKEISFKKKDKPVAEETPAEPKQSVWKKEISLGGKKKEKVLSEDAGPKQSIWKKELSLGGKKKDKETAAAAAPAPAEPEQQQSLWKKEISLGRKKRDRAVERLVEEAAQAVEPPAPEPQPATLPTAIAEAAVAAMPVEPVEPVVIEPPAPVEFAPIVEAAPALPVELAPVEEPVPVLPVEPVGLSPEIVAASAVEPEPVALPEPEPAPVADWPEPQPVAAEPEPWLAEPELPPAPEAPPAVVLHPPVPAAELDPVVAPAVPFWKKELSLSRGSKTPKAPKQPKAPKEPKAAGQPFWKKELSFKRTPKAAAPDAPTAAMPAVEPKPAAGSFLKRDLALPKLSLPSLSRPAKGGGGHNVKRFVGLKIGSSQLAAARVSNNGSAELLQLAREPLAQGVVVAGELREPDALADALKAFFSKHKLPRKNVRLGIASNRIGVRIFDVLGIDDDKQLANAIHFRAQEALPIPLDEAVLDYRVLETTVDGEGRPVKRVLLVVAYRDLVERYISACKKAGIGLAGIDLEAFALLRSLAAPHDRGAAAMVAVAIGHDRSTFAVTDGRICEFTRVLEWGGWSLNIALARALDTAPSEVEGVKRAMSLDTDMQIEGLTPEQSAAALDAVRRQLQSFARELVSSLQFYQNQPGSLAIGSIVITGGTAHLPGLAIELERLIGVPVQIGDPLARLKVAKKLSTPDPIGSLAVAIGLGIED
jgi:type IV pilus assembly protein PilM